LVIAAELVAQSRGLNVVARQVTGDPNFDAGKQYAVIIGVDKYKEWPGLRSAVKEAQAVRQALADRYVIDKFFELYDDDATAINIRRLFLETLPAQVGLRDSLLVFYAGHGQTDTSGTGFWIASDGSKDQLSQNNWIPNQQLRNMIGGLKAQRILILADACFSGDFLNVQRGANPTIDEAYFRQALRLTARQVLTSGASQSVPDESEFGRQLLDLLERNDEELLDPVTMYEQIRRGVTKTLPLLGTMPGNQEGASFVLFLKSSMAGASTAGQSPAGYLATAGASGFGDLMVRTDQAGAEVLVDGVSYGQAPVLVKRLAAGNSHTVVARTQEMSGGLEVTLASGDVKEVSVSLRSMTGNLYVALAPGSDPQGAQTRLYVDGADKGDLGTGIFKGIPVGPHEIELKGKDLHGSVTVNVGANDTAQAAALVLPVGSVSIDAPADTPIDLSGPGWKIERRGGGLVADVPAGRVDLSAGGSDGWVAAQASETLAKGRTLEWKPYSGGTLVFEGPDADVLACIDGASSDPASGRLDGVAPGERCVVLKRPGSRDKTLSVAVAPGKTTVVATGLDRFEPATVSFDDFGLGLALVAPKDVAVEKASSGWDVASGVPVSLRFSSPYAERIDTDYGPTTFAEGEARKLAIPNGRIVLPWLVSSDRVCIGSASTLQLTNQADEGFRSDPLPAGEYTVSVGSKYTGTVTVPDGGIAEPQGYREAMSASLVAERQTVQKRLAARHAATSAGWISLAAGVLGAAGAGVVYWLGDQAMSSYRGQTTTGGAGEAFKDVQLYQALFPVAAGVGGLGLGLSTILFLGGPDPRALQKSIDELNVGIMTLGR